MSGETTEGTKSTHSLSLTNGDGNDTKRRRLNSGDGVSEADSDGQTQGPSYKGITYRKKKQKWTAQIKHKGKLIDLGAYDDPEVCSRVICSILVMCLLSESLV